MSIDRLDANVAIVGGGRWARVAADVLCTILSSSSTLTLCSPSQPEGWTEFARRSNIAGPKISIGQSLESLLGDPTVDLVYVVRAARDNAPTTLKALVAGKSVLVEKPFALNLGEAQHLVQHAKGKFCATGLVFLFPSYLKIFSRALFEIGEPKSIKIRWHDPTREVRHGVTKTYDPSLNAVQDVFPHIWSLLRLVDETRTLKVVGVKALQGGRTILAQLTFSDTRVQVELARGADCRRRSMSVRGASGEANLDFAVEPGTASLNSTLIDVSAGFQSPLEAELRSIITDSQAGSLKPHALNSIERSLESIHIADILMGKIRPQQWSQIESGLKGVADREAIDAAEYALTEIVADTLLNGKRRVPVTDLGDIVSRVRDWLKGSVPTNAIPQPLIHHPDFVATRRKLCSAANRT